MVFDECPPYPSEKGYVYKAVKRTIKWAKECKKYDNSKKSVSFWNYSRRYIYQDLREECAKE